MSKVLGGSLKLLRTRNLPVDAMVKLEEALFRSDSGSWCILSQANQSPTVVMGIAGKPEHLLDLPRVRKDGVRVLRRFSGGGTVVVDHNTLFVSFIIDSSSSLRKLNLFPREIMRWSEQFYVPVFHRLCRPDAAFKLEDTDYVFGARKFGGNAQALSGKRWVHHTSFLWDYTPQHMQYLLNPEKQPDYRQRREHSDFLCKMKDYTKDSHGFEQFFDEVKESLEANFSVEAASLKDCGPLLQAPHRKKTAWVDI